MAQIDIPSLPQILQLIPETAPPLTKQHIAKSHAFSESKHGEKIRNSGELYLEHDRLVAYKLGLIGTDPSTIIAALVHDACGSPYSHKQADISPIGVHFGKEVEKLVTGHYNLFPFSNLSGSENEQQLEKLRRAILHTIDDDIRILLLRMADNLTDLEWAKPLDPEMRLSLAREASEIYAPIANRLGIWYFKWQLEDLSFRYLQPGVYKELAKQIAEKRVERDTRVASRKQELQSKLEQFNISASVKGRSKHIFSIHRKMQRKKVPFSEIYDLHALRVIINDNNIGSCYQTLGLVHNLWSPIPEEFDDYIANPKPNGYQSLHTAVYDPDGRVIEIQIRTKEMDDDAERGIAAHWAYKEGSKPTQELKKRVDWLRQLLIDLRDEEPDDAPSDRRMINIDDLSKRIYVFTPNHDLIELPEGGTPVDFAYRIHTEVGHRCKGAIVNNKMVPLNYLLQPGDKIEIITAKRDGPSRDWMTESSGYAKSARTRSRVRQWFREHDRETNILQGMELIDRELRRLRYGKLISAGDLSTFFGERNEYDFLAKVGFGDIGFNQVTGAIGLLLEDKRLEAEKQEKQAKRREAQLAAARKQTQKKSSKGILIEGNHGLSYRMANCCLPIPPEPIKGYITRGQGVTIHRSDCRQFTRIALSEPERVIDVSWSGDSHKGTFDIPLAIKAYRRPELAEDIAKMISGRQIELVGSKTDTDKRGITSVYMTIRVNDVADLDWLTYRLRTMSSVLDVQRQRPTK